MRRSLFLWVIFAGLLTCLASCLDFWRDIGGRAAQLYRSYMRAELMLVRSRCFVEAARSETLAIFFLPLPVVIGNGAHVALFDGINAEWIRLLSSCVSAA